MEVDERLHSMCNASCCVLCTKKKNIYLPRNIFM